MREVSRNPGASGLSRRHMFEASAGAIASAAVVAAAGPVAAQVVQDNGSAPFKDPTGIFRSLPPKINASTGGSPMTPGVLSALQTTTVSVTEPSFVDVFTRTTQMTADLLRTKHD